MASDQSFVDFVVDQMVGVGGVTARKMFGEYGMHCMGKFFAIIADNKLFIKPTEAGRSFIGNPTEAPPYPGAKNYFLIENKLDDREWLTRLVRVTADDLPEPKPKKKKKKGAAKK